MYDSAYAPHGVTLRERRDARLTPWEIHPVTRIERWNDARAAWAEVPR
jgi:hypothetical protein